MWIFCKHGFFSIVLAREVDEKHTDKPIAIRARMHEDLVRLKETLGIKATIVSLSGRDYPYRLYVSHEVLVDVMMNLASTLDYSNFKSMVTSVFGWARHDLYTKVWGVMNDAESKLREEDLPLRSARSGGRYKRESVVPGSKSARVMRKDGEND